MRSTVFLICSEHSALLGSTTVLARVGVSFISTAQACSNAESEIPDFDFDSVRSAAFNEWNELLGRVQIDPQGVDPEIIELFYSSLYRTHISPADCMLFSSFLSPRYAN